jgi:hypothetical protein
MMEKMNGGGLQIDPTSFRIGIIIFHGSARVGIADEMVMAEETPAKPILGKFATNLPQIKTSLPCLPYQSLRELVMVRELYFGQIVGLRPFYKGARTCAVRCSL